MKTEESKEEDTLNKLKRDSPLTWRSIAGILYAGVVLLPAVLWLYFSTGSLIVASTAMYTTALLFGELARLSKPLTKQELFIIMYGGTVAAGEFIITAGFVFNAYFRSSRIAAQFGLTEAIPTWLVPPLTSPAVTQRNLMHPDWILPIIVVTTGVLLAKICDVSLGFLARQLYIEVEELPFPMQQVEAQVCLTMAEKESNRIKIFTLSAVIAMAYAAILYALPFVSYAILGWSMVAIPQPWIDLNRFIGWILPGASFGVATGLTVFSMGFILPFNVIVSMFVGSVGFYLVGNALLVKWGLFTEWFPGMSVSDAWTRSVLGFWASPMIGLIIAAALLPLVRHPGNFVKTFRDLLKMPTVAKREGSISLKLIMALFLLTTLGSVLLVWMLVPGFRSWVWILILLSVGWTFIFTLASARAIGVTGMGPLAPYSSTLYAKEAAYIATGYAGADIWFAPLVVSSGGSFMCAVFKTAKLTGTDPIDYVKAYFLAFFVALIMGYIYVSAFWSIAPMPSAVFPCPFWPLQATIQSLFITRSLELFNPTFLIGAAMIGGILFLVVEIGHLPISLMGLALGPTLPIPYTVSYIIGAIAAKITERRMGKEWFQANRTVIVAGIFTGVGLTVALSTAIALIVKSMWASPY
jgi:hypothetical protein